MVQGRQGVRLHHARRRRSQDLFVHHSGINGEGFKTLAEAAKVSYDEEAGDKGPKAVNVTVLG